MNSDITTLLVWTVATSSGLMAGVYLAFSGFIMRAFATLSVASAIAAMNAINTTILRSSFMPLFFGSTVVAVLLVIIGIWHWGAPGAGRAIIAGAIYFIGMFVVTAFANVPLNNRLARLPQDSPLAADGWHTYLKEWTRWNSLRTMASGITCLLCIDILSTQIH